MSSNTETGYARLVSGFENFVQHCQQLGSAYNPPQVRIQLASLNSALSDARNALLQVSNAFNAYKFSTNARETALGQMRSVSVRIISVLKATDAPRQTLDDAHYLLMKIQGRRIKPKAVPAARTIGPDPAEGPGSAPVTEGPSRSVAQTGADALIEHFTRLVLLVTTEPAYLSSEPDLQPVALDAFIAQLRNLNTAAINAETTWRNAILQRNMVLRDAVSGIVGLARQSKNYVRSVFGSASMQYKRIKAIRVY